TRVWAGTGSGLLTLWTEATCSRLYYFTTGVTRPGPGASEFTSEGYVDHVQFVRFAGDGGRGRAEPRTPWIRDNGGREYWDQETEIFRSGAQNFRVGLQNIMRYYNQSKEGSHTIQGLYGFMQYGYDGRDYIALDKAKLSWTAADAGALNTKRKWEADGTIAKRYKGYLEGECIECLQRYLGFGGPSLTWAGSALSGLSLSNLCPPSSCIPNLIGTGARGTFCIPSLNCQSGRLGCGDGIPPSLPSSACWLRRSRDSI
uniref:MHC class I-like antigen recognition-like domain-containing protein n=1 Tax=Ornithorhynchus anatinus TaxID=9258 RepID=A0A6I8NWT7_ORNAN